MRILRTIYKEKVSNIPTTVKEYQRPIEPIRLNNIKKSIIENRTTSPAFDGYFPQEVIVLNQDGEPVDGQHRLQAARDCGIEEVPCVKWHFDGIVDETKMFTHLNSFNTNLKAVYVWHSRKLWGCPIANMVYDLHENPDSPFHGIIRVKGNDSVRTDKKKFTIVSLIQLMNTICFNLRAPHFKYSKLNTRMETNFANLNWENAITAGYDFMRWFKVFADQNPDWYGQRLIPAISIVYKSLKEQGFMNNQRRTAGFANHLKTMNIGKPFPNEHRSTKIMMIKTHLMGRYGTLSEFNPFLATSR